MNNTEPTPSQVAAFEDDLKGKKVKAMLYNAQASEPAVGRLVQIAKDNGIPVVGVSETEPPNATYQDWMMGQLDALDKALAGGARLSALSFDQSHDQARRPGHPLGRQFRHRGGRIRRHARRQRRRQDDADARRARPRSR